MRLRLSWICLLLAAELVVMGAVRAQPAAPYVGRSVQAVIDELRASGTPLVYSTNLLPASVLVTAEPSSREPLAIAREVLAPHGLALREAAGSWLVVRASAAPPTGAIVVTVSSALSAELLSTGTVQLDSNAPQPVEAGRAELGEVSAGRHVVVARSAGYLPVRMIVDVAGGATVTLSAALLESVPQLDEVIVTASRYDLSDEVRSSAAYFTRDEIETLADLGDDTARVAHRLPGIAANEFSARSHVRGGVADEMTVMLDGIELIEPFHLRDYQGVFSAIDQRVVAGLQVHSGGFPAEYGDALSGLMLIQPREPTELAHEVGISVLHTAVLSSGTFADGRASWLASARRSNLGDVLENDRGDPQYHDVFARVGVDLGAKHRLTFGGIGFDDDVALSPSDDSDEREAARSEVDSQQLWLVVDSAWTPMLTSRSWFYGTSFDSLRRESVDDAQLLGSVIDRRDLDSRGFKQRWHYELSARQQLTFGFEAEEMDADYSYVSVAERRGVLAALGEPVPPLRVAALAPSGERYNVHLSDRVRLAERWVAEFGLRWDRQSYESAPADDQLSPRSSVLFRVAPRTDLRLSYGRFFQSEGLLDLQVEDGVAAFAPAQDAVHEIFGVEHRFADPLVLRVEAFRKRTREARPRYENLFDPLALLPELRPGRIRVAPERAEAHGIEILLNGGTAVPWWLGYSIARVDDVIDGVHVPRSWDQHRALDAGVTLDVGRWSLSGIVSLHTGWPVTEIGLEEVDGETVAVAGERNAVRLPSLRRLDVQASRDLEVAVGSLRLFAEVTNLTDRSNPCCWQYDEGVAPDGSPVLLQSERAGLPMTLNFGALWQF
jgi:outer membrane receptor protein involved in Fe transport